MKGLGFGLGLQGLTGPTIAAVLPLLPAGAKVAYFGDSILHYNALSDKTNHEFSQTWRGEISWLNTLDPRMRCENWRDLTKQWGPYIGTQGTLGNNPFATTVNSATVTVTHTGHGMATGSAYIGGGEYAISGATAVAGLSLNGPNPIVSIPDANTFTITAGGVANATTTGGGSAVAFKQRIGSAVAQFFGKGSNYACAADHAEGVLDILKAGNGFTYSGYFNVGVDVAILGIGTNDINSGKSAAQLMADTVNIVNTLFALGVKRVIVCTVRPRGAPITDVLPADPFTTAAGSTAVIVSHPNHGYLDGQTVTFTGATAVGGLTLTGPYTISATNETADSYQITTPAASSAATGGGSSVSVTNASPGFIYAVNDARWAVKRDFNSQLKSYPWSNKVQVADMDQAYLDPSIIVTTSNGGTGAVKRNYLIDGVHPDGLGAFHAARDVLLPLVQSIVLPGVWFETDPTVSGNLIRNGGLQNTTGVVSTGATGSVPSDWSLTRTTGSVLTVAGAKANISPGIDKTVMTFTSAAGGGVDTVQFKPVNPIAYNRASTGSSITCTPQSTGANPIVKIGQGSLTNGHPIVGSQVTIANASAPIQGIAMNGTWPVVAVDPDGGSTSACYIQMTGQTSTGTGAVVITADITYSSANIFMLNGWFKFGGYIEVGAWDKWRDIQLYMQTRNVSTPVMTYRCGRPYLTARRYLPVEAWNGWVVSDPIKLDTEALTSATNILIALQIGVENSGSTSGTLAFSRAFIRPCVDPTTIWTSGSGFNSGFGGGMS